MAWTQPRTWNVGELVTADLLNTHLRDNLNALKDPPTGAVSASADYSTTSASFVYVDEPTLAHTLVTGGGDVLVVFFGAVLHNSAAAAYVALDVEVNGSRLGGATNGLLYLRVPQNIILPVALTYLHMTLPAGTHTFKLMWRTTAATASLLHSSSDYRPQFWVREV